MFIDDNEVVVPSPNNTSSAVAESFIKESPVTLPFATKLPEEFIVTSSEPDPKNLILPDEGSYAVAQVFFPNDNISIEYCEELFQKVMEERRID